MKRTRMWTWIWTLTLAATAGSGFLIGGMESGHTDLGKFEAALAGHEHVPGQAVVKLSKQGMHALAFNPDAITILGNDFQASVASMDAFSTSDSFYVVKLKNNADLAQFLERTNKNPMVAYAEPNYIYHTDRVNAEGAEKEVIPNDAQFAKLWGMKNSGQKDSEGTDGVVGADIGATKAWETTTGSKDVVVAVIDTGMDYNHQDLKDNVFINKGEFGDGKEKNGIDDDGNGFVDDWHGWNFAGVSTNDPMDDNSHGTHVSGTIGAKGNDGIGVAGVNWNVSILPVKFLTGEGSGTLADAVQAIQYATKMHANIMSNSWGGGGYTQAMYDAIVEAKNAGILFVAAAGNDSQDADGSPHYPANYQVDNVIAVAASTNRDTLASFSTFGKHTVHIAAPGNNILSSVPGNNYDTFSGTSMATPHVSGAAALLWSTDMKMTYADIKDRLIRSRDFVPTLARKVASAGRLNIYNAINGIYPPSPEPAESDWRDFDAGQTIESEHPYKDKTDQTWTVQGPANAKFIRVVFEKLDTEAGYDKISLVDANGDEADSASGQGENVASYYVPGNKVTIHFTADSSVNGWGFKVKKVQVVYKKDGE